MLSFALVARALGRRADSARAFALSISGDDVRSIPSLRSMFRLSLSAAATAGLFLFSTRATAFVRGIWPKMSLTLVRAFERLVRSQRRVCTHSRAHRAVACRRAGSSPIFSRCRSVKPWRSHCAYFMRFWRPSPLAERGEAVVASGGLAHRSRARASIRKIGQSRCRFSRHGSSSHAASVWLASACSAEYVGVFVVAASCISLFLIAEAQAIACGAPHGILRVTYLRRRPRRLGARRFSRRPRHVDRRRRNGRQPGGRRRARRCAGPCARVVATK